MKASRWTKFLLAMMAESGPGGPEGPPPFCGVRRLLVADGRRRRGLGDVGPAAPGEYTVLCFLPDLAGDMSPHLAHGMVRTLTVE